MYIVILFLIQKMAVFDLITVYFHMYHLDLHDLNMKTTYIKQ